MMKKKIGFAVYFLLASFFIVAQTRSQTMSGDYIFYRDNSFKGESYVGFLYFDETTYAARYFSASTDITLYLALNEDKKELKGERIVGETKVGDAEMVNYLRELFLTLLLAKKNAPTKVDMKGRAMSNLLDFEDKRVRQNIPLFGGEVYASYDLLCPVFCLKSMKSPTGNKLLEAVTAGRIRNENDPSFSSFKGFAKKETETVPTLKGTEVARKNYTFQDKQSIMLSEDWEQKMENQWMLKDAAMIFMDKMKGRKGSKNEQLFELLRRFIMSSDDSYVDWSKSCVKKNSNGFYVDLRVENKNRSMRIYKRMDFVKGNFYLFILSTYEEAFVKDEPYFTQIIGTYKIK